MDKRQYDFLKEHLDKTYDMEKELTEKGPLSIAEKARLFRSFEHLGKSFYDLNDERILKVVTSCYKKAERYAPYPTVKERIRREREELESPKTKPKDLGALVRANNPKKTMFALLSISFLAFALFFTSLSLTGNVVLGIEESNLKFIGSGFFIAGLIFTFIYLGNKKKTKGKNKK